MSAAFEDPVQALAARAALAVVAGYALAFALACYTLRGGKGCAWELADVYFHVPFVPVVLYLVVASVVELAADVDSRWHRSTDETRAFLALYCAQCTAHVVVLGLKRQVGTPAVYLAHHTLSIACYGHALWTGRMHFWAVLAALCEVTNIFLNNLFLFRALKWDASLPTAYKLNGVFLWLSYIAFRIVLFPVWLLLYHRDVRAHRSQTWDTINLFERYAYASTTLLLLVLSLFWFSKITSGLISAIRPPASGGSALRAR